VADSSSVLTGFALALACALGWTTLDALRKRLAGELSAPAILLGITATQVPIHLTAALTTGVPELDTTFFSLTLVAAVLTVAANLLFVEAVRLSPLSLTVPYLSFAPVATLLAGFVLLGQVPGPWGISGVFAVGSAALLLNPPVAGEASSLWRRLARERGSRLMLIVALLFAVSTAIDRLAILRASEAVYATVLTGSITLALGCSRSVRREVLRNRGALRWLALAGAVGAAALLLQFLSYRFLLVGYVDAVKRGGGNLFAVLFGMLFFAEGNGRRRLLAAAVMSAGVALVLLDS
jgi:drug/metabolite transporter (DMT)-like permease